MLEQENDVIFDNFGVTTTLTEKCCIEKSSSCFKITHDCIHKLIDNKRYKSFKSNGNNLRFIMALQTFGGGKQKLATYTIFWVNYQVSNIFTMTI